MGTQAHLLVDADPSIVSDLAFLAVKRIEMFETCWTRFSPRSELNRLNANAGTECQVSPDLYILVEAMKAAWERTRGLFDPTILNNLIALGYDGDYSNIQDKTAYAMPSLSPSPGMGGVLLEEENCTVFLPEGVGIDPGAIGKGLAADIVADDIRLAGANSILVDIGGDIAAVGTPPEGKWLIAVQDERGNSNETLRWEFSEDRIGVATSTTRKRRWAAGTRHHVIDPRTGSMFNERTLQVSLSAPTAVEAETWATAGLLLDPEEAVVLLPANGVHGVLYTGTDKMEF